MTSPAHSISSALKNLRAAAPNSDASVFELIKLADLDQTSDSLEEAERIFALRKRIKDLQVRVRELENRN